VCCSVLHCVAVCCSVLHCVAVCCSVAGGRACPLAESSRNALWPSGRKLLCTHSLSLALSLSPVVTLSLSSSLAHTHTHVHLPTPPLSARLPSRSCSLSLSLFLSFSPSFSLSFHPFLFIALSHVTLFISLSHVTVSAKETGGSVCVSHLRIICESSADNAREPKADLFDTPALHALLQCVAVCCSEL